jgi:hypothetical protein
MKIMVGSGNSIPVILGEAILLSSMQFAIGSVEMSSKFSVKNFSKDQETIQCAADALSDYLIISIIWMIGTTLILYSNFGNIGIVLNIICNMIIILWIYFSYIKAFKEAATANKLKYPTMFSNWISK